MPVKILVADDSVTMRRILELTFAGEDAQVTAVESGDAAIAKASDLRPDVILVDASMPTDGYKVAAAVRGAPGLERTAVIVLASQKNPFDDARGKAAGVDDHVIKPFDSQHVIDKVKKVLGQPRAAAAGAAARPPAPAAAPQPEVRASRTGTIAFAPAALQAAAPAAAARPAPAPAPQPAKPSPAAPPARQAPIAAAASAATAPSGDLARKLDGLGLSADQVAGVLALSKTVIEQVVWEVVPDLAESIIREEIRRLTQ